MRRGLFASQRPAVRIGSITVRPLPTPTYEERDRVDRRSHLELDEFCRKRNAQAHQPVCVELPVFVAVAPEPVAAVVVPLVGKAHGYTVVVEGPHLFDESVVELLVPLARQKRFDRLADGLPRRLR